MKRILSVFLLLFFVYTLTPVSLATEQSFTINGITVSQSSGNAVKNCATYARGCLKKAESIAKSTK